MSRDTSEYSKNYKYLVDSGWNHINDEDWYKPCGWYIGEQYYVADFSEALRIQRELDKTDESNP